MYVASEKVVVWFTVTYNEMVGTIRHIIIIKSRDKDKVFQVDDFNDVTLIRQHWHNLLLIRSSFGVPNMRLIKGERFRIQNGSFLQ